jgi:vacuolar protein-sorting-associated protein 4
MLKNNVGLIANTLTNDDYMELGIQTKNYSGADISVLVRDALMEPLRKIQLATHFKKIIEKDKTNTKNNIYWTSCSPGDKDAEEKHWSEIKPEEIKETHVTFYDMMRATKKNKIVCL